MGEAGVLVRRREPVRMQLDMQDRSILRRRTSPCRLFPGRLPDRRSRRGFGGRGETLLRARRETCCPGLRRSGSGPRVRLRSRKPRGPSRLG